MSAVRARELSTSASLERSVIFREKRSVIARCSTKVLRYIRRLSESSARIRRKLGQHSVANVTSFIPLLRPIFRLFRSSSAIPPPPPFVASRRGFSPPRGTKENQRADLIRRRSGIRSQQWGLCFSLILSLFFHYCTGSLPSSVSIVPLAFPPFSGTNFSPRSRRFYPTAGTGHSPPPQVHSVPQTRPRSLDPFRLLVLSPSLLLRGRNCGYRPRSRYPGNHEESFTFRPRCEKDGR